MLLVSIMSKFGRSLVFTLFGVPNVCSRCVLCEVFRFHSISRRLVSKVVTYLALPKLKAAILAQFIVHQLASCSTEGSQTTRWAPRIDVFNKYRPY